MSDENEKLQAEIDILAARAGVSIPPERQAAFLSAFRDFRKAIERLHRPRGHEVEIAGQFSVETIRKGAP